jgi:predicted phosphodiesterase
MLSLKFGGLLGYKKAAFHYFMGMEYEVWIKRDYPLPTSYSILPTPIIMKLAVLADIHGNYQALQTVAAHIEQWQPDMVVVAGDVVNRGPRPLECLQFVQQKVRSEGWLTVRGNHEDYVIEYTTPENVPVGIEFESFRSAYWTYQQLNGDVSALQAMPFKVDLAAPDGQPVRVVHASMRGTQDGIFPMTPDPELRDKIQDDHCQPPALVCVGHTHWPLIRTLDETLVVNVGSVGLPFDGDRRAAYGQLTWRQGRWQAEIIRLEYDRQQAERDFFESGYLEGGGPVVRLILDEFRIARPHLYRWTKDYQPLALSGELSLEETVIQYLTERNRL